MKTAQRWDQWEANPYYDPEKCGLEIVEFTEDPNADYSFWYVILWKDTKTGILYWGEDSGCSCPTPFESFHSLGDLSRWDHTEQEYIQRKAQCASGQP